MITFSVALTPAATATLAKKGFTVDVEAGAGFDAKFRDDDYAKAGANITDAKTALQSDILLKVRQPHDSEIPLFKDRSTLISFLYPAKNKELIDRLSQKKMNAFGESRALDLMASIRTNAEHLFDNRSQPWIVFLAFHELRYSMRSALWPTFLVIVLSSKQPIIFPASLPDKSLPLAKCRQPKFSSLAVE